MGSNVHLTPAAAAIAGHAACAGRMSSTRCDARVEHRIYDPQVRYVDALGADDRLRASTLRC
jgi:hypothetical protein